MSVIGEEKLLLGDWGNSEDWKDSEDFNAKRKALSEIAFGFAEVISGSIIFGGVFAFILYLIKQSHEENGIPQLSIDTENFNTLSSDFLDSIALSVKTVNYSHSIFQRKMFTVKDIVDLIQLVAVESKDFSNRKWLQKEVIDTIRFSIQRNVITLSDINIYDNYFGDNEKDEINVIALARIIPLIEFIEQGSIIAKNLNITAQKYENLVSQYNCKLSDIIKLIIHLNKKLNPIIKEAKISQEDLFNEIVSQSEFTKISDNEGKRKKQIYSRFKLGDTVGYISDTGIRSIVIPALLGSKELYKNKKLQ